MKTFAQILVSLLLVSGASAQERPWQQLSDPTAAQLAANFAAPPPEYSTQFDWGFSDTRTREAMGGRPRPCQIAQRPGGFRRAQGRQLPLPLARLF